MYKKKNASNIYGIRKSPLALYSAWRSTKELFSYNSNNELGKEDKPITSKGIIIPIITLGENFFIGIKYKGLQNYVWRIQ